MYVRPAQRQRITQAIEESGLSQQDWLRSALTAALEPRSESPASDELNALRLESAQTEIRRLEDHLKDAREQRDAASGSNERLEDPAGTVAGHARTFYWHSSRSSSRRG